MSKDVICIHVAPDSDQQRDFTNEAMNSIPDSCLTEI
jgi:hypothetical protein